MNRREFVKVVCGTTLAWPMGARAEQLSKVRRVAFLVAETNEDDPEYEKRITGFAEEIRSLGWIDGENLRVAVYRVKPNAVELRRAVAELLANEPEVIVSGGGTSTPPVLQATNKIPVVFTTAVDPVGSGLVESLAHPGGNATGFMAYDYNLSGKWLELLKQISPSIVRVGVLRDPMVPSGIGQFAVLQSVAGSFGVDVIPIGTRDVSDVEKGIAKLARSSGGGLIVTFGAAVNGFRDVIVTAAARYRLPAVYANRRFVDHGGLISYGTDAITAARRAAGYVDRILKGEQAADLPVQAPNKYELVVNLKTAKALAIELPAALLARADEVIE